MEVQRTSVASRLEFEETVWRKREPAVLYGLDLGRAPRTWTPEYLRRQVGSQTVKVHVSPEPCMNFLTKNFIYRSLTFEDFIHRSSRTKNDSYFLAPEEYYYLRSLGSGDPRKSVADFSTDYASLAQDLKLPPLFPEDRYFSSVLRVGSAGVQLWTHYDVMDNLLVQVRGSKRVILFPPSDAPFLYLDGDKSQVTDIDSPDLEKYPLFSQAHRYEVVLGPGEVLFLPALWFHHVTALEFGVAVNIFWKHHDDKFYNARDPYGNKAPPQVQRATQAVERAVRVLQELPPDLRSFYGGRVLAVMQSRIEGLGVTGNPNHVHDQT